MLLPLLPEPRLVTRKLKLQAFLIYHEYPPAGILPAGPSQSDGLALENIKPKRREVIHQTDHQTDHQTNQRTKMPNPPAMNILKPRNLTHPQEAPMLIIGCGYTGTRVARKLAQEGRPVIGTAATPQSVERLRQEGLTALRLDLDEDCGLDKILDESLDETLDEDEPANPADHSILYLTPPPPTGTTDPRLARLLDHLRARDRAPRIVYAGTTGVYGDCAGRWVTEEHPLNPGTDRARRRADAERQLQEYAGEAIILRIAGIYGPGRLPIAQVKGRMPVLRPEEAPYSNRIHVDDLVAVCLAAMDRGRPGAAYNVADGRPTTMTHYFTLLARMLAEEPPPTITWPEAEKMLPPELLSFLRENRRVDNTKMRRDLGTRPRYTDLARGLKDSLSSSV